MYDKYIIQYVVTVFNKDGEELFEKYHTNEEAAILEARAAIKYGLQATIVQHSKLTGWEE